MESEMEEKNRQYGNPAQSYTPSRDTAPKRQFLC